MANPEEHERARRVLAIRDNDTDDEEHPFDRLAADDPRYLREQARLHTPGSIDTLVAIRDDWTQPGSVRKSCAELLLAYGWGKPSSQADIMRLFLDHENGDSIIRFEMPMTVDGVKDDDSDGKARAGDLG
jgi:hypothetical protein